MSTQSYRYDEVVALIDSMIDDGRLATGDKAPSLRRLARQLGVSVNTVLQGYQLLERRGTLLARPQSGYYVEQSGDAPVPEARHTARQITARRVNTGRRINDVLAAARAPGTLALGTGELSAGLLPVKALNRSLRRVIATDPECTVQYAPIQGDDTLRSALSRRLTTRHRRIDTDDILITNGATEALSLTLRTIAKPGDVILVESPTYFTLLQLIQNLGMLALEVDIDPQTGLAPEALEHALQSQRVAAVVSVGTFHNPTGSLVPDDARARIVELLHRHDVPLIEDDIYSDMHFSRQRPRTYQSFDRHDRVICCSSFSKTLAPGYRLGWIVAAPRWMNRLLDQKLVHSMSSPALQQRTVADLLDSGGYERHLGELQRQCRQQVLQLRNAIHEHFPPGTAISEPQGGFVLWVQLPRGCDALKLYQDALQQQISITPGTLFSVTGRYRQYIRLCAKQAANPSVYAAVATLGQLLERQLNTGGGPSNQAIALQ